MIVYAKKAKEVREREALLASTHWGRDLMSQGLEDEKPQAGMTVPDGARPVPGIAIVTSNTLEAVGLASLIHTMMPQADIRSFAHAAELAAADDGRFAHYFISAEALMEDAALFDGRHHARSCSSTATNPGNFPPTCIR